MADDVSVKFGADTRNLDAGIARATQQLQGFTNKVNEVAEKALKIGQIALAGQAIKETIQVVTEFINKMAELGNQTEDTAAILGVTTERIGELNAIAMGSGDSLSSIANGMERLALNISRAAGGSPEAMDLFHRLGVNIRNTSGELKSLDEITGDVADSMARHANGAEKTAIAIQLMGRSGAQLIPILNQGREGFREWEEMAHRTGTALSGTTVAGMVAVQKAVVENTLAFQGLGVSLFNVFQPAILGLLKTIAELVERFSRWIQSSYDTGSAMRWLALVADTVVTAIMAIVAAFELLWSVASAIIQSLSISLGSIAKEVAYALSGQWDAAAAEGHNAAAALVKTWSDTGADMGKILGDMTTNIKEMWAATLNPPTEVRVPYGGPGGGGGGKPSFAAPTDLAAMKNKLDELKTTLRGVYSEFQSIFSNIIGGFDRAISGLLNGTMTWKDAMLSVVDSLWQTFVKFIEDWVSKWLAGEATMLVAHQTANGAKVASDIAAQDTASTDMILNAIKAIFVSSKQTTAGVTANLAPTLGPLALPAGVAAGAAVAGLASFDVGSWEIPRDQVAQVHEGEMIVPAKNGVADAMREMLATGGKRGDTYHTHNWNGPVLDRQGLARTVVDMLNNNPSLRGSW